MSKQRRTKTFKVQGFGQFPYDMLRYDNCWPATESDSVLLESHKLTARVVTLETDEATTLTPDRWRSFGWVAKW